MRPRAGPKYDGMIKIKMQANKEIFPDDASGTGQFTIHWGDQTTVPALNSLRLLDTAEIVRYTQLYDYWCIQGCKIKYIPYTFGAGDKNISGEELLVGSSVGGNALNGTNIRLAVDFNVKRATSGHNKYIGVAKARMRNTGTAAGGALIGSSRWQNVVAVQPYQ